MKRRVKLEKLLLKADKYHWNEHIYMCKEESWSLQSTCYLFNLDNLAEDEDDPKFAVKNNLRCVLSVADLQDVVLNLKEQKENCSPEELFEAFVFYYENDAFIECEEK